MFTSGKTCALPGFTSEGRLIRAAASKAIAALARRVVNTLLTWDERARMRHQFESLDDRLLKDIGLTRTDTLRESGKPFWRE